MISRHEKVEETYFKEIGDKVIRNQCPYCGNGMVLQTQKRRTCEHCSRIEESPVGFKYMLRFEKFAAFNNLHEIISITVLAKYTDSQAINFQKVFDTVEEADSYLEEVVKGCIAGSGPPGI